MAEPKDLRELIEGVEQSAMMLGELDKMRGRAPSGLNPELQKTSMAATTTRRWVYSRGMCVTLGLSNSRSGRTGTGC
jgi:hypothetical protein